MAEHEECKHLIESISSYVDGTLSQALCAELEKHLRECENCVIEVNTIRKTIELYQQVASPCDLPDDVRKRLYRRLHLKDYVETNRPGSSCPVCGKGTLEYDGMLNLSCKVCGFIEGGCFT